MDTITPKPATDLVKTTERPYGLSRGRVAIRGDLAIDGRGREIDVRGREIDGRGRGIEVEGRGRGAGGRGPGVMRDTGERAVLLGVRKPDADVISFTDDRLCIFIIL